MLQSAYTHIYKYIYVYVCVSCIRYTHSVPASLDVKPDGPRRL